MIEKTNRHLIEWIGGIKGILDQVPVSLEPPAEAKAASAVSLYLMEFVQSQPARTARRAPLLMTLRYLVTTQAAKPEDAHQMLEKLIIAAYENPDFQVEQEPLPLSVWSALGIPPRPAFVLRVPYKYEPEEKRAKLVKAPIVIQQLPLGTIEGKVLGPEDIPLTNARVELPAFALFTNTDSKGRFHFSAVPAAHGPRLVRVWAKGQEFSSNPEQAGTPKDPLVIHFPLEE